MHLHQDAPDFQSGRPVTGVPWSIKENDKQPGHWRKKKSMSTQGLKSRRTDLLLDEENGKCNIVRCCAEFLSIGNHSSERERTRGGLGDWRHSQSQWKLEQNIITRVVSAEMVANALLCYQGRSHTVLPEVGLHPTRFRINGLNGRITGRRGITWLGKPDQCSMRSRMDS